MRPAPQRIGRFEIQERLGAGAMGVVYKARDTRLDRDVALKVLAEELITSPDAVRRFEQEARAASSLNHPNIVTVFDAGLDDATAYIVTELLQGTTLGDRMAGRALRLDVALDFGAQIADGLRAAHAAGIVHRDIKPQNIFVTRAGTIKILDFGVSRLLRSPGPEAGEDVTRSGAEATQAGAVVGTPAYMAPEQIRAQPVDARTDIFAFGCVLHEMLTGAGPYSRGNATDVMAAILTVDPPVLSGDTAPPLVSRIVARCLAKDPADRFQSAADLGFAIETARASAPASSQRRGIFSRAGAIGVVALVAAAGAAGWLLSEAGDAGDGAPVVLRAATVVPASARPIAPAISPDGQWVAYVGLTTGEPRLYAQFLNAGPPVWLTQGVELPLQNRTIVGGIDVLPDGTGVSVAGRPRPVGLWQVPGIWVVPAPLGGPPRKLTERYASVRWSPDGRRIAAIIADPLVGDAVAVADADGLDERIVVPASGGTHYHHVAWGHDGRYVYYSRTLEPNHTLGEIDRVPADGGPPEVVVATWGTAMYPMPTPDGRALLYAGNHGGEGLNIWWRPLDGGPEHRLTSGSGEYTEPYISRDGRHIVALARRRRGGLVRVPADTPGQGFEVLGNEGSGDAEPAVAPGDPRVFFTSTRGGGPQIWSLDPATGALVPVTSGRDDDRRPSVSGDGRQVAFISNRNGRRGIWTVSADGGTARLVVEADVIDFVSWAPDHRRLVYGAAGREQSTIWIVDSQGGAPTQVPVERARVPAWSPAGDEIAFVTVAEGKPWVHFVSPDGRSVRERRLVDPVSLPTALAWSPDGRRLAMVNLPGRAAAEAWILDVESGQLRKVAELPAPAEFHGVAWSSDGRSLVLGRAEYESEVLLIELR